MALFTDGPISCIEDLTAQDSQLLNVASVEGIDTARKIEAAQDAISMELLAAMNRSTYGSQMFWLSPLPQLDAVVVTPSLKLWHTAHALELVYADAYNSQLNDRYAGKRQQFHDLARWAYGKLIEIGVGIAGNPIPRAAMPAVTPFPGSLPDGLYYVSMTWLNRSGEEGAPAGAATISTASSTFLVAPVNAPQVATGWNIYAGNAPEAMYLQNIAPLAVGQTWEQPSALTLTGSLTPNGQKPSYLRPLPRIIQRG